MDVVRQFTAIAITLITLAGALWLLRHKGLAQWRRAGAGRVMEVIESRHLGPGHTLHLVRIADRVMALATHSGGCTLIDTRPWSEVRPPAAPEVSA